MNKAVFVTGGTVGSGLACAERFAKEGYDVFITSRNGERAKDAADEVSEKYGVFAKGYALDIRDEQRVIDIFNDIDGFRGSVLFPQLHMYRHDAGGAGRLQCAQDGEPRKGRSSSCGAHRSRRSASAEKTAAADAS